jgi:hypothetical protein
MAIVVLKQDVLKRFDPRPESGQFVATGALLIPTFTPTIGNVHELGILLTYLFRFGFVLRTDFG